MVQVNKNETLNWEGTGMEILISICLGVWIMISGIVCYMYMKNDKKREEKQ